MISWRRFGDEICDAKDAVVLTGLVLWVCGTQMSEMLLMIDVALAKMYVDVVAKMCYLAQNGDLQALRVILADSSINPDDGDYDRRFVKP